MEPPLSNENEPKKTINLNELHETITNKQYGGEIFLQGRGEQGEEESFQLIHTLGKRKKSYLFWTAVKNEHAAIKMSYWDDNYETKLENIIRENRDEYKRYYLNLREPPFTVRSLLIEKNNQTQKLYLDKRVYVQTWEGASHILENKINESFDNKFKWFKQFLKGLSLIHTMDRAHFDIKLANLFLVNDRVKIGHFELYPGIRDLKNKKIQLCGTPGHIAPEMFDDISQITPQADIFSAGAAFTRLFLGIEINIPPHNNEFIIVTDFSGDEHSYTRYGSEPPPPVEKEEEFKKLIKEKNFHSWRKNKQDLFKLNYHIFNSLKIEIQKKLKLLEIKPGEIALVPYAEKQKRKEKTKLYQLLLNMMEIHPGNRIKLYDRTCIDEIINKIFIPDLLIGQELGRRYSLTGILDGSGRGIVYKAFDQTEGIEKAIKLFPPRYNLSKKEVGAIKEELINTRKAAHRNVVNVDNFGKDGNLNFIVMEYIQGESLDKILKKNPGKRFKEEDALSLMKEVLLALMDAHENDVTHNALQPKNIMITEKRKVKLLNFGWDYQLKKALEKFTDVIPGIHDWYHLPPEMYPDNWQRNPQADIWGFGVTLYQLLKGELPYQNEIQTKTRTQPTHKITGISNTTSTVLLKCLKTNKLERYQNIKEIYNDLFVKKEAASPKEHEIQDTLALSPGDTTGKRQKTAQPSPPGKFPAVKTKKLTIIKYTAVFAIMIAIAALIFILIPGRTPYYMWYTGKPGKQADPGGGIGLAFSTDGIKWNRYSKNPIIPGNKTNQFKDYSPAYPYIVHHNSTYHMLFKLEKPGSMSRQYEIGYAKSSNGIHWDMPAYNPVTLDNNNIASPGPIIYQNGKYHMWYNHKGDIYYAGTEPGGFILQLKKHGTTPVLEKGTAGEWDDKEIQVGTVIFDTHDNLFKIWYTGKSKKSNQIGYATSTDGIQWNKHPDNPVYDDDMFEMEMFPAVVKVPGGYNMYYTAAAQASDYYPVRLATSTNGITWKKHSNIPVLSGGKQQWEKMKIFVTAVTIKKK